MNRQCCCSQVVKDETSRSACLHSRWSCILVAQDGPTRWTPVFYFRVDRRRRERPQRSGIPKLNDGGIFVDLIDKGQQSPPVAGHAIPT